MVLLKQLIVYTLLGVYIGTFALVVANAFGGLKLPDNNAVWMVGLLITQTVGGVVAIVKAPSYFEDPEAILQLKAEHAEHMRDTVTKHSASMTKLQADHMQEIATLKASHTQAIGELEARHSKEIQEINRAHSARMAAATYRPGPAPAPGGR